VVVLSSASSAKTLKDLTEKSSMISKDLERQLAIMETRIAQEREEVRVIIASLTLENNKAILEKIEEGKTDPSPLSRFLYKLADIGLTQVLTEWNHLEEPD
jgi:hypothetical protein